MFKIKSYPSIDLFKFVMSIAVVAIHTDPLINLDNNVIHSLYDCFVALAVPFFFMSTGFLLYQKFTEPFNNDKNFNIIKNYIYKICKLYITWMLIYTPISIYHFVATETNPIEAILKYIRGFIFIGEQYNAWPLWYLLSSIYALIIILILLRLKCGIYKITTLGLFIYIISILISRLTDYSGELNSFLSLVQTIIKYTIANGRILRGFFYIPLGMFLAKKELRFSYSVIIFLIGYGLNYFCTDSSIDNLLVAFTSIGLFEMVIKLKFKSPNRFAILRQASTVIYFIHMYIWSIYYMLKYGEKEFGIDCFLFTATLCSILGLGYAIIRLIIQKKKNSSTA